MQKRLVSLVLALALMLTAFAGCGSDTGSSSSAASGSSAAGSSESSTLSVSPIRPWARTSRRSWFTVSGFSGRKSVTASLRVMG